MFCTHCGTEGNADDRFCRSCGRELEAEAVTTPLPEGGQPGPSWSGRTGPAATDLGAATQRVPAGPIVSFEAGSCELGGIGRRIGAFTIDLAFAAVTLLTVAVGVGVVYVITNGIPEEDSIPAADQELLGTLIWLIGLALIFIGTWVFNATGGTLGKRMVGLRIVRDDLRAPGFAWGLGRTLSAWLSWAPFGLGFLWATWDERRQTWHDKMAGTYVVRTDSMRESPVPRSDAQSLD